MASQPATKKTDPDCNEAKTKTSQDKISAKRKDSKKSRAKKTKSSSEKTTESTADEVNGVPEDVKSRSEKRSKKPKEQKKKDKTNGESSSSGKDETGKSQSKKKKKDQNGVVKEKKPKKSSKVSPESSTSSSDESVKSRSKKNSGKEKLSDALTNMKVSDESSLGCSEKNPANVERAESEESTDDTTPAEATSDIEQADAGGIRFIQVPTSHGPFYCPYKDCEYTSLDKRRLVLHIRHTHDSTFSTDTFRKYRSFKTPDGDEVKFDESSQNLLDWGEKMIIEPIKKLKQVSEKRPRCPYAFCKTAKKSYCQLFDHIRELHDPSFPEFRIVRRLYTFKTKDGRIIDFQSDEDYALGPDEKITVEKILPEGSKRLYCPYQSCSFINHTTSTIYYHIRTCHDMTFPLLDQGHSYSIKTEDGRVIDFEDENVRGTVSHSQGLICDIISPRVPKSERRLFCPYRHCDRSGVERTIIFNHIRRVHDPDLMMVPQGRKCTFRAPNGMEVRFDENSRNSLNENEKLTGHLTPKRKCRYLSFCPYAECGHITRNSSNMYYHVRKYHDPEFRTLCQGCHYSLISPSGELIQFTSLPERLLAANEKLEVVENEHDPSISKRLRNRSVFAPMDTRIYLMS